MSKARLPPGWASVQLNEVLTPRREKADPQLNPTTPFVGLEHIEAHTTRLIATVPAGTMRSAGVRFSKGDVLYGRLRPYLNKVHRASFDGIGSGELLVFPGSEAVDAGFLSHRLNSLDFVEFSTRLNEGDRPRVDFSQIGLFRLSLPPLTEQRRIVAVLEARLSELDAAAAAIERVQGRLETYVAALAETAVEGNLISSGQGIGREPQRRQLNELFASIDQGWSPKCLPTPPIDDQSWGIIKTTAVQPARYDGRESKALPADLCPRPELEIQAGDLLVTRKGPRRRAGVAAAVCMTRPKLMICDTVYRIRLDERLARPHFLAIVMNAPSIAAAIDAAKAGISESGVSLTHGRLGAILVPVPSLEVQQSIEQDFDRRVDAVGRAQRDLDTQLIRASRLRQSILSHAFEGKLVPHAPSEEPASALLERIRRERAAKPAQKQRLRPNAHPSNDA